MYWIVFQSLSPLFSDFMLGVASGRAHVGIGGLESVCTVLSSVTGGVERRRNTMIKVAFVPCSIDYSNVAMATNLPQIAAANS